MDPLTRTLFEQLGISLLLGLLVGLQRQHTESPIAGLRTFPLVTVMGTLAAMLDQHIEAGGWIIAATLLGIAAVVIVTNLYRLRREQPDFGMTTEVAILLMFLVGAYVVVGSRVVAVAVGGGVAVILQFKPELHGLAEKLGDKDLRAIMQFVLITCIILPALPDRTFDFDPYRVFNPREAWLMVVLVVGISLGGYLVYKFFGSGAGILLGGILGGAISSTVTTVSYARRVREERSIVRLASVVVAIATVMVYVRTLLEIAVAAPSHFVEMAPPIAVILLATAAVSLVAWLMERRRPEEMPTQQNPTELRSALIFAALFVVVLFALAAARAQFGGSGTYVIAFLSGLTNTDALTLSTARLVEGQNAEISADDAWKLIVVATMANLVFKAGVAGVMGSSRLLLRLAVLFAIPFAASLAVLLLWPLWN